MNIRNTTTIFMAPSSNDIPDSNLEYRLPPSSESDIEFLTEESPELTGEVNNRIIETDLDLDYEMLEGQADSTVMTVTSDYNKLSNLPSINGTILKGNYDEIDPTVHEWAKAETKPEYTAEEVGAVSEDAEITNSEIYNTWSKYF